MDFDYYKPHIERRAVRKADLTPLYIDIEVFSNLVADTSRPFRRVALDKVAGPEALGFIVGGAVALRLKKGFVPVRKGGALPTRRRHVTRTSFVDYTTERKTLELNKGLIEPGERILVVDDWIETGAQIKAVIRLVERLAEVVVGVSTLGAHRNEGTKVLFERYNLHAIDVVNE